MNKNVTKAVLTSALLLTMATPSLFAQQRPAPQRGDRPEQAMPRPMPGRPERQNQAGSQASRAHHAKKHRQSKQHRGFFGIRSQEWSSLSTEDQRKLKILTIELGLTDRPKMDSENAVNFRSMSKEERLAYFNSPEVQAARNERMGQMRKFWQEAAKLNVGPLSAERKAESIAKLDRQQERIDQQRKFFQ